uniref:NADH-ubiquinone oxidoreductase chain 2 n=1 Tax=Bryoria tenuis TaxID=1089818 RepID=A0A1Y9TL62_9LECA|nr:NADH dehydrogenase subunit 2 [Bryoria tenuis]ARO90301.1 NADH dehydrogenase subunit 2 [Bryoria tenuis]
MILYSILFLLLSNAVTFRREKSILYSRKTIIILLCSCLVALKSLDMSFLDRGIGLYGGLFHATPISQVFHIFIFFISAIILLLTAFYSRKVWVKYYASSYNLFFKDFIYDTNIINKMGQQYRIIEYPLIILFIIIGGTFLVSASDIVSIFLSIELQSYGLYILSTLYRNSELSTSAGLTYFLLGGLSSCLILLGTSLLYANSGTTNLDGYYVITGLSSLANDNTNNLLDWYKPLYLNISLLIMSVGFLFKISAAPFHFWSPDVYDAIPTIVTTYVAIIAKISILIFLLELVHYTSNFHFAFSFSWTSGLLFSSFLSLIIGTVLGLSQFRIKRLFAYSTISHLGFILLALSINSLESIQAFLFYLIQYSISNLNAFVILISVAFSLYPFVNNGPIKDQYNNLLDRNNSPIQLISQFKGYFNLNPILALSLAITLFSFVGIPPLIGFFAKQMVLSAALDSGYVFLTLIAILTSVISAVYYLGIIKQIFFDQHQYILDQNLHNSVFEGCTVSPLNHDGDTFSFNINNNIVLSSSLTITISILTLTLLFFMFTPQELINITTNLALILFNS